MQMNSVQYSPQHSRRRQQCQRRREAAGETGGPRSPPVAWRSCQLNRGVPVGAASADSSTTSRTCSTTKRAGAPVADASPHDRDVPRDRPSVDATRLSFSRFLSVSTVSGLLCPLSTSATFSSRRREGLRVILRA